jgi:uncharacterized protein (DUF362 family)
LLSALIGQESTPEPRRNTALKVILKDQTGYDPAAIAEKTGAIIQSLGLAVSGRTVFVKPSFVYPSKSPTVVGVITHPQLLVGVLRALRDAGAKQLLVGESSVAGPSRITFRSTGVLPLLKGLAQPVFLDEQEEVEVKVKDPWVQETFKVPRIWLESDLYVSLPKIKTNLFTGATLTIKNNLGLLRQQERLRFHDHRLHQKLADLYKVRPPDLVVADCVVAGEGQGPIMADPVELGLMVGGDNAIAVDRVACHLTGYEPEEIEHLKLLIDAGYGPGTLDQIEIEGRELLSRARKFRRADASLAGLSPRLRVFEGSEHSCPWGCAGLVRGALDAYLDRFGPEDIRPMNVIVGKPIAGVPDDLDPKITLVIGDCAQPFKHRGTYIPGCCPVPLFVGLAMRQIMGPLNAEMKVIDVGMGYMDHGWWRLKSMLSGRWPAPIENHSGVRLALKDFILQARNIGKMNPARKGP